MIAKIIAHGDTREQAIARLRRAVADTMVAIEDGTTNQGFLLELLGRPELRAGEVDTGWLDRLQAQGDVEPVRHADAALVQAAIALCEAATAAERGGFYALARRGRPSADADVCHTLDLLHRGVGYRFQVCQTGPRRFLVEVDGARIEATVEQLTEHERRLSFGGRSHRTVTALQDADLLVEVDGVPHRVSRDEGGLIRSHSPGVVVAIPVEAGDEVQPGDVVAVTESMKMESSLTATVHGRVREVLVSANAHVPAGRPLLQIDPIDDDAVAEDEGERIGFEPAELAGGGDRAARVGRARLRLHAGGARARARRRPGAATRPPSAGCSSSTPTSARSTGRTPTVWATISAARRSTCTPSCARSTPRPRACRSASWRTCSARSRTTAWTGWSARGRWRRPRTGCSSPAGAPPTAREAVRGILAAHLERREPLDDAYRAVLDRLEFTLEPREPALAELAREVRWRCCDEPALAAAREATYDEMAGHLAALGDAADPAEREAHVDALVDCPQPLSPLLNRLTGDAGALVEAMTRRYYRIRPLEGTRQTLVGGVPFALAAYERDGRRHHVAATLGEPEDLPGALRALAAHAATIPAGEPLLADVYALRADGGDLDALLAEARLPDAVARVVFVLTPQARDGAVDVRTFARADDGSYAEDPAFRGLHPMMAERMDVWRLREFDLERAAVRAGRLPVPRGRAREPARRAARGAGRGARPHARARRGTAASPPCPSSSGWCAARSRRCARSRPAGPRAAGCTGTACCCTHGRRWSSRRPRRARSSAASRARAPGSGSRWSSSASACATATPSASARCASSAPPAAASPSSSATRRAGRCSRSTRAPSGSSPRAAAGRCTRRRSSRCSRRSAPSPAPRSRPASSSSTTSTRRAGSSPSTARRPPTRRASSSGVVTNRTERHPEGMRRVVLLGDPTRALGSLAEPECRRVIAALDLAEELEVPVEWFALSSGAKIAMDSGTENMDWVAAALKRIVALHPGRRRDQHRRERHQRRRAAVLERRGHDADAHQGHPRDDARQHDGPDRQAGARLLRRGLGRGQLRHRRLRARDGPQRPGAVLGARSRRARARRCSPTTSAPTSRPASGSRAAPRRPTRSTATCAARRTSCPAPTCARSATCSPTETNPGRKQPFDVRSVMRAVIDADQEPLERWAGLREGENAIVWDARLGGRPVALLGIESRPLPRFGPVPADGPEQWSAGTLFPQSSRKIARAINAASGRRPLVVLANLAGFDGSPESMRRLQLEYGAEIGRAIVNFDGPIAFCVISRFHGGAFVVFSRRLNEHLETSALEGAHASVIGGAPAAAVVFAREVDVRTREDARIAALDERIAAAEGGERERLRAERDAEWTAVRAEKLGELASEFDGIHSVERAVEVGSVDRIVPAAGLRPYLIDAVERGIARVEAGGRVAVHG